MINSPLRGIGVCAAAAIEKCKIAEKRQDPLAGKHFGTGQGGEFREIDLTQEMERLSVAKRPLPVRRRPGVPVQIRTKRPDRLVTVLRAQADGGARQSEDLPSAHPGKGGA